MNRARAELLIIGLNRKYPQDSDWTITMRPDGDIRFTAGWLVRIMSARVFINSPSVLDVWNHIEKYWNLGQPEYLDREKKRLGEVSANEREGGQNGPLHMPGQSRP